jgi:diaminohydroxyphosphoribosylaminopyrimidine deaminase/5-amino-6-(5-phosphoribosylamino)uracil reductase
VGVSPHLSRAYELARPHHTHPNPRVGAVVVGPDGQVLSEGAHDGPGLPHAEVVALDRVENASGSTIYVSLEPCSHHGRTPPCTDRLIADGVAKVVIGTMDPDPQVAGSGVAALRQAGIEVEVVDDPGARDVDPAYFHHRETGTPLVRVKWAMTLDGSVAAADGTSRWITTPVAREDAHWLRSQVDAVVVGAGTLRTDDPRLDVRIDGYQGPQPRPVIVAGTGALPEEARIWDRDPIVVTTLDREIPAGELVRVDGSDGLPDPVGVCLTLADMGLLYVLLEGGPTITGAWWRAGVVTGGFVHIGAKVGGGAGRSPMAGVFARIADADDVEFDTVRNVSDDVVIAFRRKS